jgi:large subunit ribosomal protein L35
MPKMKTHSSSKKRFKVTKGGLIKAGQAGKRHGMIKHPTKANRTKRGTTVLCKADTKVILNNFLPYSKKKRK